MKRSLIVVAGIVAVVTAVLVAGADKARQAPPAAVASFNGSVPAGPTAKAYDVKRASEENDRLRAHVNALKACSAAADTADFRPETVDFVRPTPTVCACPRPSFGEATPISELYADAGTLGAGDALGNASLATAAVPEPASAAVLAVGGLALIIRRRRTASNGKQAVVREDRNARGR